LFLLRGLLGDRVAFFVFHRLAGGVELRIVVFDRLHERHGLVRRDRLRHALRDEHERENDRQRQQDVERAAREVDQKLPIVCADWRANPRISAITTAIPARRKRNSAP